MPPRLEVRRITALSSIEQREIVMLLADAFDRDLFFRYVYPETGFRREILRWLFIAAVKDAVRFGQIDVAYRDKFVGVGINYPPGCYPISFIRNLRLLWEYLRIAAASPFGFVQLYRALIGLNKIRPVHFTVLVPIWGSDRASSLVAS